MTRIEKLKELNNTDVNDLLALVEMMREALIQLKEANAAYSYPNPSEQIDVAYRKAMLATEAYDKFNEVRE